MNHLITTPLRYTNNLIAHYQSLSELPGFILLESNDHQRGRYDIVTAYPYDVFKIPGDVSCISSALKQLQRMLPSIEAKTDLPFQGGAIGYFSYDLGSRLAGIHSLPHPCNDMPLADIRFYDWAIVADHYKKTVQLVAVNFQKETKAIIDEIKARWDKADTVTRSFVLEHEFTPLITQQDYKKHFAAIYEALIHGRAYQVNYTQPFLAHYKGDAWEMYKRVRTANPVPYSAFLRCTDGDILCFSPERFLTIEKGRAITSPIKGTTKRSSTPVIDEQLRVALVNSSKNQAENTMIVDLLRNDLGKLAKPGSVKVTSLCEVQSFNAVHHLVSNIEAEFENNISPLDIFMSCFPGGSITGAPKLETMHIINEHEAFARGVYCGSIAYFSAHGRMDSNIAIRTITAKKNTLYLSAGGGIVIDSHWQDEYRECFTKIAAIVNEFQSTKIQ